MLSRSLPRRFVRRAGVVLIAFAWLGAIGFAADRAMRWDSTPGRIPAKELSARANDRWRLLVVAHPLCPCTRATLQQLGEALENVSKPVETTVLFIGRADENAANVREARLLPSVHVEFEARPDPARDHGALTSGHTFLFDPQGRVRFSGGLTDGRGSVESSMGRAAIKTILQGGSDLRLPVYGCPLLNEEARR